MATRVVVFQGTIDTGPSRRRVRDFLGNADGIASVTVALNLLSRGGYSIGSRTWDLRDGGLAETIEEIVGYISRDDVSVTISA